MYFLSQGIFFTEKLGAKRLQGFGGFRVPGNFAWAGTLVCKRARALQASEGIASKKNKHDVFLSQGIFLLRNLEQDLCKNSGDSESQETVNGPKHGLRVPRNFPWAGTLVCKRARALQVKRINTMYFLSQGFFTKKLGAKRLQELWGL